MPKAAWTFEGPEETDFWKASGITFFLIIGPWIRPIPHFIFAEHSGTLLKPFAYELSRARLRLFVLGEVLDETRCLAEDLMTGITFMSI